MQKKILCPSCDEKFEVADDIDLGEIAICDNCYLRLKVVHVNPLKLVEVKSEDALYRDTDEAEMNQ